jgi:TolB protein
MPDFDTRQPQESDEPNGLRSRSLTNRVRNSLIANRLRTLLIGGGITLFVGVGISVGLVMYSLGGPGALTQELLGEAPNGKLAFAKRDQDIYVMNPDGTGESNLTNTSTVQEAIPAWSPDGEKIAFVTTADITSYEDLYVMNADGSDRTMLAYSVSEEWPSAPTPAWSPDGEKVAVVNSGMISVMNADGSGMTNLTDTSVSETRDATVTITNPVWSPDSEKIAFTRRTSEPPRSASATAASAPMPTPDPVYEESGIYVVNADGSGQSSLIKNEPAGRYFETPAWSPDGERIAFEGGTTQGTWGDDIYVMNADGSGRTKLTDTSVSEEDLAWSRNGEKIAFHAQTKNNPDDIYVMNADGTARMRLSDTPRAGETNPTWSPDGEKIAFWVGEDNVYGAICVINADGTGRRCVADEVHLVGASVAWGSG